MRGWVLALAATVGGAAVAPPFESWDLQTHCFGGDLPGTKDRTGETIKLAYRNWVSHDLATMVTYHLLKDFLRYDVQLVDAKDEATSNWGPNMVDGLFDLDMEQWQIASDAYRNYVVRDQLVTDYGPIGYPGRGGIFLANSPVALAVNSYGDYYVTYQDAAQAIAMGLPKFGDIDIRAKTGAQFPVCDAASTAWCGSGALEGYWAPPQCSGVASDPAACVEVIMMMPSWDSGYFEQLTTNFGMKFVHGYYGAAHNDLVRDIVASGKPALFYWYTPDPLVPGTSAARLSFPDFFTGCTSANENLPDGPVACDYPELSMLKLGHGRLRQYPEATLFLRRVELLSADIEGLMLNHTSTGGPYDASEAACMWIKSNMDKVEEFAPSCIVKPKENPKTGDFVFDQDRLECVQTTVYEKHPPPPQCVADADLGSRDRSKEATIKIGVRGWLSQDVGSILAGLVLKDILRYTVEFVNLSPSSTSNWGPEISSGLFHFDSESWQAAADGLLYKKYIKEEKTVLDLGEIGYGGRGAIFTFKKVVDAEPESGFYKFFTDAARAQAAGFPMFGDIDIRAHMAQYPSGGTFPMCTPAIQPWCQTGALEGYWGPPACQANPAGCVEFLMASPTYDTAYFEQLTRNLGLKVVHGYYGWDLPNLVKDRFAADQPTMFYWWEPDPFPPSVGAMRLSYPDFSYGCDRSHNRNADTGGLACDYPETKLRKLGAAHLPTVAPEAYYFLSNYQLLKSDIETMMASHPEGGGPANVTQFDAACLFLRDNIRAKLGEAFPSCISYPKALEDIAIGDTVFDPDNFVCKPMTCPKDKVLKVSDGRIFCQECPDGLAPNAAQTACGLCDKGTAVNANRTACEQCAPGRFAENKGQTECLPCAKGSFMAAEGSTACELCAKGSWQDQLASVSCKACTNSKTTDSRGMFDLDSCQCAAGFFEDAAGQCTTCPEGMTCDFGSKVANIALYGSDPTLPIPRVDPGYYTASGAPLSVYLCDGLDVTRCPGGLPSSCLGGLEGLVCEVCPDGEARQDGVCKKCDSGPAVLVYLALPLGLCILALIMFKVANDKVTVNVGIPLMVSVLLGLVVTTIQTIALFPGLSLQWKAQGDLFGSFKFFLGSPDGIPLACALSGSPVALFLFRCLLPFLCVLAVFVVWGISLLVFRCQNQSGWNLNIAINTTGQLLQTLFIAIAVLVVQPMRCYGHPNDKQSMTSFPQVLCWEDDDHTSLVILGFVVGVFFIVPFLAICVRAVIVAPKTVNAVHHYQRYRFLLYRFRADVWWWGIVFLFRQLALAFSSCIPADSPQWQITYVSIVTAVYLTVVAAKWPWKNSMLNYIDVASMLVINFIIVSAGGFVSANSEDTQSFVVFHFIVFFSFAVLIAYVLFTAAYWAKHRGLRGAYGSDKNYEKTAKAWCEFVAVSAALDARILTNCVKTFTEFDVQNLVKAMGSFQSVEGTFGDRLAPRLHTISHSSSDIDGIANAVRQGHASKAQEKTTGVKFMVI